MMSTKQGSHWYYFNVFGMARQGIELRPSAPEADVLQLSYRDRSNGSYNLTKIKPAI